jgi:hypothetical protein
MMMSQAAYPRRVPDADALARAEVEPLRHTGEDNGIPVARACVERVNQ